MAEFRSIIYVPLPVVCFTANCATGSLALAVDAYLRSTTVGSTYTQHIRPN